MLMCMGAWVGLLAALALFGVDISLLLLRYGELMSSLHLMGCKNMDISLSP
jgi:hypothetical protein